MNPTSLRREGFPVGCERWTAVLHSVSGASPPVADPRAQAVLRAVLAAPMHAVALADLGREFGPETDVIVRRLLSYPPADASLVWTEPSGRLVYVGQPPQAPVLPKGQCWWAHGFSLDDFIHNARPHQAVAV